jgi:hypothetical protein
VDCAVDAIDATDFDQHISIMSLPHVFGVDAAPFPPPFPICSRTTRRARWARRIAVTSQKVGLVWARKFRTSHLKFHMIDPVAACRSKLCSPCSTSKVDWYSPKIKTRRGEPPEEIIDFMAEIDDFATAAIVRNSIWLASWLPGRHLAAP